MRPLVAVIGNAQASDAQAALAEAVGRALVERGLRLLTGGLGGVMEAASRGARSAANYREGDIVGILPGADSSAANPFVDIVIPSGMGVARNVLIVSAAQAVIAIGGGAGTLSEIALAWQLEKPIVGLRTQGFSGEFAGQRLDDRARPPILAADDAEHAVLLAMSELL